MPLPSSDVGAVSPGAEGAVISFLYLAAAVKLYIRCVSDGISFQFTNWCAWYYNLHWLFVTELLFLKSSSYASRYKCVFKLPPDFGDGTSQSTSSLSCQSQGAYVTFPPSYGGMHLRARDGAGTCLGWCRGTFSWVSGLTLKIKRGDIIMLLCT